jgi:hypothetical protein
VLSKVINTRGLILVLLAVCAATVLVSCGPPPPPSVDAVTMTKDVDSGFKATSPTTTFSTSDPKIYASVTVSNLVVGTTLSSKWYFNGTEVPGAATSLTQDKAGSGYVAFSVSVASGIPTGNWKVEVYLDGKLVNTTPFTVQ